LKQKLDRERFSIPILLPFGEVCFKKAAQDSQGKLKENSISNFKKSPVPYHTTAFVSKPSVGDT
jgi:hypothetical protein